MRTKIVNVRNFITTHRAPIAFAAGICVGVSVMRNAQEWQEFLDSDFEDETAVNE